jgi:Flp pilus assembly protein TadG
MIRRASSFWHCARGSAAVQFALAVPVLVILIAGIAQLGVLYAASAGMQQALGEGARAASLYPRPTDDVISAKLMAKKFALDSSNLTSSLSHGTSNGLPYVDIQLTYTPRLNFVFFTVPSVTITKTRRAYLN